MGMAGPGMGSLTCYQANRYRMTVRALRRVIARPGIESLTCCQANRTRVAVRTIRHS